MGVGDLSTKKGKVGDNLSTMQVNMGDNLSTKKVNMGDNLSTMQVNMGDNLSTKKGNVGGDLSTKKGNVGGDLSTKKGNGKVIIICSDSDEDEGMERPGKHVVGRVNRKWRQRFGGAPPTVGCGDASARGNGTVIASGRIGNAPPPRAPYSKAPPQTYRHHSQQFRPNHQSPKYRPHQGGYFSQATANSGHQ